MFYLILICFLFVLSIQSKLLLLEPTLSIEELQQNKLHIWKAREKAHLLVLTRMHRNKNSQSYTTVSDLILQCSDLDTLDIIYHQSSDSNPSIKFQLTYVTWYTIDHQNWTTDHVLKWYPFKQKSNQNKKYTRQWSERDPPPNKKITQQYILTSFITK
jgi:hypothetical protein